MLFSLELAVAKYLKDMGNFGPQDRLRELENWMRNYRPEEHFDHHQDQCDAYCILAQSSLRHAFLLAPTSST